MIPRYVQTQEELDRMETVSLRTLEGTVFIREPREVVIETAFGKVRVSAAEISRFINWYELDQPECAPRRAIPDC